MLRPLAMTLLVRVGSLLAGLACASCSLVGTALDSVRWETPLDGAKDTRTITDAVASAREAGSAEHKALQEDDPEALAQATREAGERERELREQLDRRVAQLETAQQGAIAALTTAFPGAAPTLAGIVSGGLVPVRQKAGAAAGAADSAARVADSAKGTAETGLAETTSQKERLAEIAGRVPPGALDVLREKLSGLEEASRSATPEAFRKLVDDQLAVAGLSSKEIEGLREVTGDLSSRRIYDLLAALAGGGLLGTAGGRGLSRSGKRIDAAKKEIDELYDDSAKLKVRLAQFEAAARPSAAVGAESR